MGVTTSELGEHQAQKKLEDSVVCPGEATHENCVLSAGGNCSLQVLRLL